MRTCRMMAAACAPALGPLSPSDDGGINVTAARVRLPRAVAPRRRGNPWFTGDLFTVRGRAELPSSTAPPSTLTTIAEGAGWSYRGVVHLGMGLRRECPHPGD